MLKRTMLVAVAVSATLVLGAATAGAQVYPPPANFCTISDTTPTPGQTVTISCGTYLAGATVTFTFLSTPVVLGTVTADANGVATLTTAIPSDATLGDHTITVTGESAAGPLTQTIPLTVVSAGAGAGAGGVATGAGGLPRTGTDSSLPLARTAALLIAVGGVLVLAARRRRAEADVPVA